MIQNIQDSVALITSQDGKINRFGTGFIIRQVRGTTYLLTCAHVVEDVGGENKVKVDGADASVVASGKEIGLDLAMLKVDGLLQRSAFNWRLGSEMGNTFKTIGFQSFGKDVSGKELNRIQALRGSLGEPGGLQSRQGSDRIKAWELRIADNYSLQPGYSGSPVIDEATGKVIAVVSHRQGDKSGLAISIEELNKIWILPDSEQLYQSLLELGYRDQIQLFRQITRKAKPLISLAIHGEEFYGQCWLLNRLVAKHIRERTTAKVVRIKLGIKVRHNDIQALWRELGEWFGSEERQPTPSQIIEKIYQSWQTQHVLLLLHEVDRMPPNIFDRLIQEFWIPLTQRFQEAISQGHKSKLLLFLVDYRGAIEQWKFPFVEQVDDDWEPHTPIRTPKLIEFSYEDLSEWMEDHRDRLPSEFVNDIDSMVASILEESDNGIPEIAFDEICDRCGCDWEEESKKWLRH